MHEFLHVMRIGVEVAAVLIVLGFLYRVFAIDKAKDNGDDLFI